MSRLHAVKRIVRDFVLGGGELGGRPADLLGLIAFAGYADAFCPLTLDHLNLIAILDQLEINADRREAGTAIGEGIALAVERLRRHSAASKVIILLTDGVNNAGAIGRCRLRSSRPSTTSVCTRLVLDDVGLRRFPFASMAAGCACRECR